MLKPVPPLLDTAVPADSVPPVTVVPGISVSTELDAGVSVSRIGVDAETSVKVPDANKITCLLLERHHFNSTIITSSIKEHSNSSIT